MRDAEVQAHLAAQAQTAANAVAAQAVVVGVVELARIDDPPGAGGARHRRMELGDLLVIGVLPFEIDGGRGGAPDLSAPEIEVGQADASVDVAGVDLEHAFVLHARARRATGPRVRARQSELGVDVFGIASKERVEPDPGFDEAAVPGLRQRAPQTRLAIAGIGLDRAVIAFDRLVETLRPGEDLRAAHQREKVIRLLGEQLLVQRERFVVVAVVPGAVGVFGDAGAQRSAHRKGGERDPAE